MKELAIICAGLMIGYAIIISFPPPPIKPPCNVTDYDVRQLSLPDGPIVYRFCSNGEWMHVVTTKYGVAIK